MLLGFVVAYWIISVAIGLWVALRVHNTADYAAAGHSMPLPVVTATVFATWFGSETVLGIPATFLKEGLHGVVADPFGSSLCLVLVGLFFAVKLYRKKLLTIGDFYRHQYGRSVEVLVTLCIVISYLGWVAAQIKALGLVFNVVSEEAISKDTGMIIGAATVMIYTLFGGMLSVAITDFIQMIIIMVGMLYIGWDLSVPAGGVANVIHHASLEGKFNFWPKANLTDMVAFFTAWITMMLGSIPQQDVFQRVTSSNNEKTARNASVLGGSLYFLFAFVPIFLAYSATLIAPDLVSQYLNTDSQLILPKLILEKAPLFAQIMFFGALLSAIKSCASATLLAPSVTFAENIVKGFYKTMTDDQLLKVMRIIVFCFTVLVTYIAIHSELSIFKMVENAYKITLVAAFVPLVCGLYWKRATPLGGLLSVVLGGGVWLIGEWVTPEAAIPPQLAGLLASCIGMVLGSLVVNRKLVQSA
ncbi:MAG: sodium:solute symporter [Ferrovum sp. 37-45-19]|uniref:sodium:solute symporter family protein n=1 Tax=Ferrovum sp. JA12 TaxID=1356299 RepID=UPI000702802A|nr:sodium:solute symporter family protein [Ferrovum sp. JA12]OYV79138.1 MAG: sodium:solute symporter [Ferrovum sp. 21-44-67]OYV93732.1 MAG: sodium:solute symporter [Ferrovum sp. 37-45-19]OZB32263.1 MAG: sodium:solute symporter [Ferrovum sp. 34-44-207]HQT81338.1 sodium:solute symporter family protein [Ferrovaceae bacterium]KRH78568.1 sodium/pantothenate symporter [Ferrovum sp. JA12]